MIALGTTGIPGIPAVLFKNKKKIVRPKFIKLLSDFNSRNRRLDRAPFAKADILRVSFNFFVLCPGGGGREGGDGKIFTIPMNFWETITFRN